MTIDQLGLILCGIFQIFLVFSVVPLVILYIVRILHEVW